MYLNDSSAHIIADNTGGGCSGRVVCSSSSNILLRLFPLLLFLPNKALIIQWRTHFMSSWILTINIIKVTLYWVSQGFFYYEAAKMWLMLGFHQQFLNATPKTAESEHDEMVRWSRCLKVQTGTKPEIQLEVTKLLSAEYTETFKTCLSPAQTWVSRHTLVWGGRKRGRHNLARLNRCRKCKSARYGLTIVKPQMTTSLCMW